MREHQPAAYGRHWADVYDQTAIDLPTNATVDLLAKLAGPGPVCEFGIGTGRLALPLAQHGLAVAGVEASADMVDVLRRKPGGADIPVTLGDFADVRVPGEFSLVVLAFNTIFALPDQAAQVRCFANAAAHLGKGGRFVVEAWVPDVAAFRHGAALRPVRVREDEVVLEAATLHPAAQRMHTTRVRYTEAGTKLLPANHRYAWPAELDLMAQLAGMHLESRWQDWFQAPFTDDSAAHVCVYRKDDAP